VFNDSVLWHSHNLFLEVLLQVGLVGLVLFILLIGSLLRSAVRHLRSDDHSQSVLGVVAAMIILGMLIRNMTDMLWVRAAALTFWGALGLVFGLASRRDAARTVAAQP
jgi:O-antigen ligase